MTDAVTQGSTTSSGDAEWWAFQGKNPNTITSMRCGNVFFGITMSFSVRFDLSPFLPPGSTIQSASMRLTSFDTRTGAQSMSISAAQRSAAPIDAWAFDDYTGWRAGTWESVQCSLVNTSLTQFFQSHNLASNQAWVLRLFPGDKHQRFGELLTLSGAGSPTLGFATMRLRRVNNATGNIWIEITDQVTVDGVVQPGNVLATSNMVDASTVPTTENNINFTFTGADQIVMPDGDYAIVLRGDTDYLFDQIQIRTRSAFFFGGTFRKYGKGVALDDQNYPSRADVLFASVAGTNQVVWAMPAMAAGVQYTTPDLTAVIQEAVDDPRYEVNPVILIACAASGATGLRRFRTWDFDAGVSAPVLDVTYTLPDAPGTRTFSVRAETRVANLGKESRAFSVQQESRSFEVPGESRDFVVEDDRTFEVE